MTMGMSWGEKSIEKTGLFNADQAWVWAVPNKLSMKGIYILYLQM